MTEKLPVMVSWYPADERGRKTPPMGDRYFGVFKSKAPNPPDESWSVLFELDPPDGHKFIRNGMLSFLSDDAPIATLGPGSTFYLFEGRWPVAEGVVLSEVGASV